MRRPVWNWWQKKRALGHYVNATPADLSGILGACQSELVNKMIDAFYADASKRTAAKAQVTTAIATIAARYLRLVVRVAAGGAPQLQMPGGMRAYDHGASAVNELDQRVAALLADVYDNLQTKIEKKNTVTRAHMDPSGPGSNPVICNAWYVCKNGTTGEIGTGKSTADAGTGSHAEEKWFHTNVETTTAVGRGAARTNVLQTTLAGLTSDVTRIEFNITIPVCHDEATCRTKLKSLRTAIDDARKAIRLTQAGWNRVDKDVAIYVFIYRNNEFWPVQFPVYQLNAAGDVPLIPSGYWF